MNSCLFTHSNYGEIELNSTDNSVIPSQLLSVNPRPQVAIAPAIRFEAGGERVRVLSRARHYGFEGAHARTENSIREPQLYTRMRLGKALL